MFKKQKRDSFYVQDEKTVLSGLESSKKGLTSTQAKQRLADYGYNELEEDEKRTILAKFIDQFKDLMIIILLVAAALSVITEGMGDLWHHYWWCPWRFNSSLLSQ